MNDDYPEFYVSQLRIILNSTVGEGICIALYKSTLISYIVLWIHIYPCKMKYGITVLTTFGPIFAGQFCSVPSSKQACT